MAGSMGRVLAARNGLVSVALPGVAVGDGVRIKTAGGDVRGVVRGVDRWRATVMPWASVDGVVAGDFVHACSHETSLGMALLGRAVDASGSALDGRGFVHGLWGDVRVASPPVHQRVLLQHPLWTGVRAIDALLTLACGARVGIFGAPGCGKSSLLAQLSHGIAADAIVVALIGERGREAREWIDTCAPHASIVCATSDRPAAERVAAAQFAFAQANALRSRGLHVLVLLDSLARYAAALREIGLACGEPCGRGGFPASVFVAMAALVEVAGATRDGSITLVATVLSDADGADDPVSEAARSLLDGHFVLSPSLAQRHHYPAVDILASTSRTMAACVPQEQLHNASAVRRALAALRETEDARALGLPLNDPFAQRAQSMSTELDDFLAQGDTGADAMEGQLRLAALAAKLEGA